MAPALIESYEYTPASCLAFDARAADVASAVAHLISGMCPSVSVEHVGSTSIPGCDGKGVVDLMAVYPDGMLVETRSAIDALGFQKQTFGEPFPEERPMRVGSMRIRGARFRIHVHVLAASSWEVEALRHFRDRLRSDASLTRAYVRRKRELIESGVKESPDYARAKGGFITSVLKGDSAASPAVS